MNDCGWWLTLNGLITEQLAWTAVIAAVAFGAGWCGKALWNGTK